MEILSGLSKDGRVLQWTTRGIQGRVISKLCFSNLASRMQIDALVEAVDTKAPWQSDESQGNSCHAFCSFFQNHRFTGIFAIKSGKL